MGKAYVRAYNIWLPSSQSLNTATGFVKPVPYDTITIPATATGCISET